MNDWKLRITELSKRQIYSILILVGFILFLTFIGLWIYRLTSLDLNFIEAFTLDTTVSIIFLIPMIVGIVLMVIALVLLYLMQRKPKE